MQNSCVYICPSFDTEQYWPKSNNITDYIYIYILKTRNKTD